MKSGGRSGKRKTESPEGQRQEKGRTRQNREKFKGKEQRTTIKTPKSSTNPAKGSIAVSGIEQRRRAGQTPHRAATSTSHGGEKGRRDETVENPRRAEAYSWHQGEKIWGPAPEGTNKGRRAGRRGSIHLREEKIGGYKAAPMAQDEKGGTQKTML